MELILRSDNESSIAKIVDLAAELNIPVEIHNKITSSADREELKQRILSHKGRAESSFGDPLEWQLKVREDRELPFRDR